MTWKLILLMLLNLSWNLKMNSTWRLRMKKLKKSIRSVTLSIISTAFQKNKTKVSHIPRDFYIFFYEVNRMDVNKLEEHLDIRFHDKDLLIQAFTHSSYANEYRHDDFRDNERLEFLGDAVLELAVSEYLFSTYKDVPEGHLTKLRAQIVCEPSLYHFAKKMNFGDFLRLGK